VLKFDMQVHCGSPEAAKLWNSTSSHIQDWRI